MLQGNAALRPWGQSKNSGGDFLGEIATERPALGTCLTSLRLDVVEYRNGSDVLFVPRRVDQNLWQSARWDITKGLTPEEWCVHLTGFIDFVTCTCERTHFYGL